jgi:hypothetical protein
MTRNSTVLDLGGTFRDHHHVPDLAFGRSRVVPEDDGQLALNVDNATIPYANHPGLG